MAVEPRPCDLARRRWLAGLACGFAATAGSTASQEPWTEVWVDLDEPVAAGARDAAAAQARRERVVAQQERVARELHALGAVELARVHHARNAIAVRVASSRLDAVRGIAGVVRLRPLRSLRPPRTHAPPP